MSEALLESHWGLPLQSPGTQLWLLLLMSQILTREEYQIQGPLLKGKHIFVLTVAEKFAKMQAYFTG